MKRRHWTLTPWFLIFGIVMLMMTMATYSYNLILCYVELAITVAAFAVVIVISLRFRNYIKSIVRSTTEKIKGLNSEYLEKYKYPVAIAGEDGGILWCNARFRKSLCGGKSPEGESINSYLSGFDVLDICDGEGAEVAVDGKEFTAFCISAGDGIICHFIENTYYKNIVREYHSTMPCIALITFDNAEDFVNDSDETY